MEGWVDVIIIIRHVKNYCFQHTGNNNNYIGRKKQQNLAYHILTCKFCKAHYNVTSRSRTLWCRPKFVHHHYHYGTVFWYYVLTSKSCKLNECTVRVYWYIFHKYLTLSDPVICALYSFIQWRYNGDSEWREVGLVVESTYRSLRRRSHLH